jgi:hypothetical protein
MATKQVKVFASRTHFHFTLARSQQLIEFPISADKADGAIFHSNLPTRVPGWGPVGKWLQGPGTKNVTLWVPTRLVLLAYLLGPLGKLFPFLRETVPGCAGIAAYRKPDHWFVTLNGTEPQCKTGK